MNIQVSRPVVGPPRVKIDTGKVSNETAEALDKLSKLAEGIFLQSYDETKMLNLLSTIPSRVLTKHNFEITECDQVYEDNLLHLSVLENADSVSMKLIELAPDLIVKERKDNGGTEQTPFHIAIGRENLPVVKAMLTALGQRSEILMSTSACGSDLLGTAMMGELPLSIAALTNNDPMIRLLLGDATNKGANPLAQNNTGDTLAHTIIKWGVYNPDNSNLVVKKLKTMRHILENVLFRKLMYCENTDGLTPLQLAMKTSQFDVFQYLMSLKDVYVFRNQRWGLEEIYWIDITDLDRSCWLKMISQTSVDKPGPLRPLAGLEVLFYVPVLEAIQFTSHDIINEIINQKWKFYKNIFFFAFCLHIFVMSLLTAYTIYRTYVVQGIYLNDSESTCVNVASGLSVMLAILYLAQEGVRMFRSSQPWLIKRLDHHIMVYRLAFSGFGLLFIAHFGIMLIAPLLIARFPMVPFLTPIIVFLREGSLLLSLVSGWFLCMFFFGSFSSVGLYCYMFWAGLLEVVKFFPVVFCVLIPFPVVFHKVFLVGNSTSSNTTTSVVQGFENYWESGFTTFQWWNALAEVNDIQSHSNPFLSKCAFVGFVVVGNILLLNLFIAILTNRKEFTSIDRDLFKRLQKLAMVIFLEDILREKWQLCCGHVEEIDSHNRFLMKVTQARDKRNKIKAIINKYLPCKI